MIYLLLAGIVWGSSFPVITYALRDVSPLLFLVLRFALAFVLLLPRYRSLDRLKTLFSRDLILISIPNSLAFILQYKAQQLTTASKTALFVNSSPLFVALFSAILLKERLRPRQVVALVVAFSGVVVTSTRLDFSGFSTVNMGDIFCMLAGISWAVFVVYSSAMAKKHGAYNMSQALCFWAAVGAAPFAGFEKARFASQALPALLYLCLVTTILAYYLYLKGVRSVPAVSTSILILVEVVVAFLISHFLLGESFSPVETVGVVLVMAGVVTVVTK
ncbi:MAG: putative permease [Candidatus Krumholzibacteriota bacterium]|nr:putative permease [Candidatus Krumholzibacteriota bacterium]